MDTSRNERTLEKVAYQSSRKKVKKCRKGTFVSSLVTVAHLLIKIDRVCLLFRFARVGCAMESLHVPSHAERVIAAEIAQIASELQHAGFVYVPHVPLHVRLVGALVRAERARELRVPRVHLAAELHVPPEQILQWEDFLAEAAHVTFVRDLIVGNGLCSGRYRRLGGHFKFIELRV